MGESQVLTQKLFNGFQGSPWGQNTLNIDLYRETDTHSDLFVYRKIQADLKYTIVTYIVRQLIRDFWLLVVRSDDHFANLTYLSLEFTIFSCFMFFLIIFQLSSITVLSYWFMIMT